jgi:hypothetical protein
MGQQVKEVDALGDYLIPRLLPLSIAPLYALPTRFTKSQCLSNNRIHIRETSGSRWRKITPSISQPMCSTKRRS